MLLGGRKLIESNYCSHVVIARCLHECGRDQTGAADWECEPTVGWFVPVNFRLEHYNFDCLDFATTLVVKLQTLTLFINLSSRNRGIIQVYLMMFEHPHSWDHNSARRVEAVHLFRNTKCALLTRTVHAKPGDANLFYHLRQDPSRLIGRQVWIPWCSFGYWYWFKFSPLVYVEWNWCKLFSSVYHFYCYATGSFRIVKHAKERIFTMQRTQRTENWGLHAARRILFRIPVFDTY